MQLYKTLEKLQKNRKNLLITSEDFSFYNANKHLFANIEMYKPLLMPDNEFDIIRANAIIRAIQNKNFLEQTIIYAYKVSKMKTDEVENYIHEQMTGKPYMKDGDKKIYVPIFSKPVNDLYYEDFGKLLVPPFSSLINDFNGSCIDLFEVYNFSLYDSIFTKLITIYKSDDLVAYYSFDYRTIYIINDQGRLEVKIALFDKYLHNPDFSRLIERITPVVEAYISGDREQLYKALTSNKLISQKLINKIRNREWFIKRTVYKRKR